MSAPLTQASPWPSSHSGRRFGVGPLDIRVEARDSNLSTLIDDTLSLFDVDWRLTPAKAVTLDARMVDGAAAPGALGEYLVAARMRVDSTASGMRATTDSGASIEGRFDAQGEAWRMLVPSALEQSGRWWEVEDLLSLVATTGWRRAGWVPLHAAGLTDGKRGVLICAPGGGGKSSLSIALMRRGWQSIGDDKLLLGSADGETVIAGVKHIMNIDPRAATWFPELAGIGAEPAYAVGSPKRRVPLTRFWPLAAAPTMVPTDMILLERGAGRAALVIEPLSADQVLIGLLRQTVIPRRPDAARAMTRPVGRLAARLRGLRVVMPDDAYSDPSAIERLEAAL